MPEGPEIWILGKALQIYYNNYNYDTYGKHLLIMDRSEDWSFGLTGKVYINENNVLEKVNSGLVYGEIKVINNINKNFGQNWMTYCDDKDLENIVNSWKTSKKQLGTMLLDQSQIAGIGVAWGSEILAKANLRPEKKCCEQDLTNLVSSLTTIRDEIHDLYLSIVNNEENLKNFINNWFKNLYSIRQLKVYKKGQQIKVGGRTWYTTDVTQV